MCRLSLFQKLMIVFVDLIARCMLFYGYCINQLGRMVKRK